MGLKKIAALLMAVCLMVSVCAPVFAGGGGDLAGEVQAWTDTTKTTEIMYMEYREEPHAPVWNEKKFEGYTWKIYTWGDRKSVV